MATDPAAPPARRMYWQLPVFAVGLAAALMAWRAFPLTAHTNEKQTEQDRYSLRQAIGKRPVDLKEVSALLIKLGDAGTRSDGNADIAYAQGSAYLMLAEAEGGEENWKRANALLGECDVAKLTDKTDRARLAFRAAKAAAGCGAGDPTAVLSALGTLPAGEEPGERSRLIADTCLRLPVPDKKRAKEAYAEYLSAQPRGTPEHSARLKLTLADLCVETNEAGKARTWLKEIADPAPVAVQAEAKLRLARLAQAEGDTNEATKQFQAADALPNLSPDQKAAVRYETGRGLIQLGNPQAGREYLKKVAEGSGPAAKAAAVRMAELACKDLDPSGCVVHLEAALKDVAAAKDWTNPHIQLAEMRTILEGAVAACKGTSQFPAAARAAELYRPFAENGRDRELLADVLSTWALTPNAPDAAAKMKRAAEEYQALADMQKDEAAKMAYLRKAADSHQAGGYPELAAKILGQAAVQPEATPEIIAAAHLQEAEAMLAQGKYEEPAKLLIKLTGTAGPVGTKAKLRLALADLVEGKKLLASDPVVGKKRVEEANELLTGLANGTYTTADEKGCHQEALYELGKLQLGASVPAVSSVVNPSDAETRFRRLVTEYPTGDYADRGNMWLGIALSQLAQGAGKGGTPPADAARKFAEAKKLFEKLGDSKNEFVRKQADIRLVHTLYWMKDYDSTVTTGMALADKHRGKVEELILLNTVYSAYAYSDRNDLAKQVFAKMQTAFAALPDSEFTNNMDEYRKAHWEKVLGKK